MNNIKEHLQRYLDDKASDRERHELMKLNHEGKLDDAVLEEIMKEIFKEESTYDMSPGSAKQLFAYILSHRQQARVVPLRKKWNWVWAAAAMILIVATSTISWMLYIGSGTKQTATPSSMTDKLFTFTDMQNKYIRLPDESTVILNKGSELSYRESYGEDVREVTLAGEAYFDVKTNTVKPFVVRSGNITTKVLGTAFNVKAYAHEQEIIVTVTEGKVQVFGDERELDVVTPDQQIAVNKATRQFTKTHINNAETALEWTSKFLILDHVTLEEAAAIIAERYKVKITLANEELKKCRVMATFLNGESLTHVLTVVSTINQAKYAVNEDGSVVIDGKGCN